MSNPDDLVEQTAKRLSEVEALQQTLALAQQELRAYHELLTQKLTLLRDKEVVPLPVNDDGWEDLPKAPAKLPKAGPLADLPEAPKTLPMPVVPPLGPRGTPAPQLRPGKPLSASRDVPAPKPPSKDSPGAKPAKGLTIGAAPGIPVPPRSSGKDTVRTRTPVIRTETEPEPEANDGPPGERRASPRRVGNPVSVQISSEEDESESFQGWVVDRSSGGIRLLVDQAFDAGTILNLRPTKAHPSLTWIKVEVKSCRPERNSYKIGCEFVTKPSWAELQAFG